MKHYLDLTVNVKVLEGKLEPQTKNGAENAKCCKGKIQRRNYDFPREKVLPVCRRPRNKGRLHQSVTI